jgi:hypothetical protein
MKLKYDLLVKQILAETAHDKDGDGDADTDDWKIARDQAIKKAQGKEDKEEKCEECDSKECNC